MNTPQTYSSGNPWQKKVYQAMSSFLESNPEIKSFGQSRNGNTYKHLLTLEQSHFNFINEEIFQATIERFSKHKAGDFDRIMTNTAASQPYCFNLIIYLQQHLYLANQLFSELLGKQVSVRHLEPEFTPNTCDDIVGFEKSLTEDESIGDQDPVLRIGTDADTAVFYIDENGNKGVLIIEFKFIEAEFSVCTSYSRKEKNRSHCNSQNFFNDFVLSKNTLCGYNKYRNWDLTEKSKVIDGVKIKSLPACPFRFGLNQLWRNILLAEQVASARQCDEFGFWVFSPIPNDKYLWKQGETEKQFRSILTEQGNRHFKKVHLETVLDQLQTIVTDHKDQEWLMALENKYRI